MEFIDTHIHLDDKSYTNLEDTLEVIRKSGCIKIINVGADIEGSFASYELSKKHKNIYYTLGIHPYYAGKESFSKLKKYYQSIDKTKLVGIGECGLDFSKGDKNKQEQIKLFLEQVDFANELNLPVILHTRDAVIDTYNILKDLEIKNKLVIHCFNPAPEFIKLIKERGFYVSIGGTVTYNQNDEYYNLLKQVPLDKIMFETDGPYLSPQSKRGQVNDSSNILEIGEKLSYIFEMKKEKLFEQVLKNTNEFFNFKDC